MRCTDCGYDGVENIAGGNCVKCGAKLQNTELADVNSGIVAGQQIQDSQLKQTIVQTGDYNFEQMPPVQDQSLKKTVVQGVAGFQSDDLKATIAQGNSNGWNAVNAVDEGKQNELNYDDEDNDDTASHQHFTPVSVNGKLECPNCHYPLSSDSLTSCPNCMADFTGLDVDEEDVLDSPASSVTGEKSGKNNANSSNEQVVSMGGTVNISRGDKLYSDREDFLVECDHCKKLISAEFKYCPYCATEVIQRTIAFRKKRTKADVNVKPSEQQAENRPELQDLRCRLSLVPDDDEEIEAFTNHYEGNNIILNRANTDTENPTITSKQQAELIFDKGNWFIENRSEYGTTFIAVNRRIQIKPGDVIMLGDRRFIFGIDETI